MIPCRRFALPLAGHDARLGGDVTRYVFIVEDLHLLLLVGLPTHYQRASALNHGIRTLPIGVGKVSLPALRTVLAVLPHTALQSLVSSPGMSRGRVGCL